MSVCHLCKEPITGKKVIALDKAWHPEHFLCAECKKPIEENSFNEHNGQPLCENDYSRLYRKMCALCHQPLYDKYVRALQQTWHEEHFLCTICKTPLVGRSFVEEGGAAYCEEDYHKQFAPRCHSCQKPIQDLLIHALGVKWHQDCFQCQNCRRPIQQSQFQIIHGKPHCNACTKGTS